MTIERSRQSNSQQVRNRARRPAIGRQIQAAFDSLPEHIAVLDAAGTILAVNAAWRHFAETNRDIERTIISAHSVEQIAQAALRAMYRLIPSRHSSVVVFDFDSAELYVVAVCVDGEPSPEPPRRISYADITSFAPTIEALRRGEIRVIDLRDFVSSRTAAAALVAAGPPHQGLSPPIVHCVLTWVFHIFNSTP